MRARRGGPVPSTSGAILRAGLGAALLAAGCVPTADLIPEDLPGGAARPVEGSDPVLLRWKLSEGRVVPVALEQVHAGRLEAAGGTFSSRRTLEIESVLRVGSVAPSGVAAVEQDVERVRVLDASRESEVLYDSRESGSGAATEPPGPVSLVAGGLLSDGVRLAIDPLGRLLEARFPAVSQSAADAARWGELPRILSEHGWREGFGTIPPLPEAAVRPGAVWEFEEERHYPYGPVRVRASCTYRGRYEVGGRLAHRIDVEKRIEAAVEDRDGTSAFRFEGGRAMGRLFFDEAAGLPLEYHQSETYLVRLGAADGGGRQEVAGRVTIAFGPLE